MSSVMFLLLVMAAGTAIEITQIQSAKSKVQSLTDNMGLTAAVYIRDNDMPPTTGSDGYVEGANYTVEDLNLGRSLSNVSGHFSIVYNDEYGRAEASFNGHMKTGFLAAFNKPTIGLTTRSHVQYPKSAKAAVSVALIVDNSGSMAWDDKPLLGGARQSGTVSRIDGLIATASTFNENLNTAIVESNSSVSTNHLRIGMIPYNTDVIYNRVQDIDWGALNEGDIDNMTANGGTDSRGPLAYANNWMDDEEDIHYRESGETPKKYVVLMSDGSNNDEWICDWQNKSGTQLWRRFNGYRYDYRQSSSQPGSGWAEGSAYNCSLQNRSNTDSLDVCTQLKLDGVEVFTIGFALEPGTYYADYPNSTQTTEISQSTTNKAYGFLSACATSSEHFIAAKDAAALEQAFEKIGKKIVEDAIRISG